MAEYIEREALLSELQEEIDFETSMYTEEQNKYFNMGLKCAVRDVKSQPTADVVPRSEVEQLQKERDEYKEHVDNDIIYVHRIKAEVVREIFEEIDGFFKRYTTDKNYYMDDIENDIAKLKKKYTEADNGETL